MGFYNYLGCWFLYFYFKTFSGSPSVVVKTVVGDNIETVKLWACGVIRFSLFVASLESLKVLKDYKSGFYLSFFTWLDGFGFWSELCAVKRYKMPHPEVSIKLSSIHYTLQNTSSLFSSINVFLKSNSTWIKVFQVEIELKDH